VTAPPPPPPRAPRPRTLRTRVVVVLAIAAVVPTLLVGGLAVLRAQRDVEAEVVRGHLALIRALASLLDGTLQDGRRAVELAVAAWADPRPTVPAVAPAGQGEPDTTDAADADRLRRRLRRQLPLATEVTVLTPAGARLAGPALPPGLAVDAHSYGGYVAEVEPPASAGPDAARAAYLIVQARNRAGALVGVVAVELALDFVADALAQARLPRAARVLVVDGRGRVIATAGAVATGPPPEAVVRAQATSAAVEGWTIGDGDVAAYRALGGLHSLRGVPWSVLLVQPEADAFAVARATRRDTLWIGALALVLAVIGGALLARRLTRPLAALAARADVIARGDAGPAQPAISGPGEIGVLGARMEEMGARLHERAQLAGALARGDRLASVGVMSAQVAHEINNPLTTVLGYARLLLEDKPADHPDHAGLTLIAEEAERMKGIVGGLLDYARAPGSGPGADAATSATDLARTCQHVAGLIAPELRRGRCTLQLAVDGAGAVAMAAGDLQQVLFNLVQNAIHAMASAGGAVRIQADLGVGGVATVVRVVDEGPGVPTAHRARVFDPFFTTKGSGHGTGLGLAVCRHLVLRAGGTIEVGPGPDGRGAEFRLVLPRSTTP
jgi:signal transduction histidine kinase